jgi:hypothetical protein
MPPNHRHRVIPLRQLVAPFEVVYDLRPVRAAQLHQEVEGVIHGVNDESFHIVVTNLTGRVQVFQL